MIETLKVSKTFRVYYGGLSKRVNALREVESVEIEERIDD